MAHTVAMLPEHVRGFAFETAVVDHMLLQGKAFKRMVLHEEQTRLVNLVN